MGPCIQTGFYKGSFKGIHMDTICKRLGYMGPCTQTGFYKGSFKGSIWILYVSV